MLLGISIPHTTLAQVHSLFSKGFNSVPKQVLFNAKIFSKNCRTVLATVQVLLLQRSKALSKICSLTRLQIVHKLSLCQAKNSKQLFSTLSDPSTLWSISCVVSKPMSKRVPVSLYTTPTLAFIYTSLTSLFFYIFQVEEYHFAAKW